MLHNTKDFCIPLCQRLVLVLTNPTNEALAGQHLTHSDGSKSVLSEAKVEQRRNIYGSAKLLLLLGEVGASNEANGALVPEF